MSDPRLSVLDMGLADFESRPELKCHLAELSVRALAQHPGHKLVVDLSRDRKELDCGTLLAMAVTLSQRWRHTIPGRRVGVVFPAGLGSFITNLALTLLDKVPVNLNFTAGRAALEASLRKAGITTVITAGPVMEKLPEFPWPAQVVDLVTERAQLSKLTIVRNLLLAKLLPAGLLLRLWNVPRVGGNREAAILFSSGSTGDPKGVVLSHRNIIGNCLQVAACGLLHRREKLMANLPTFHSFGFTITLWYPLLQGIRVVTLPSPLEIRRIAQAIKDEQVTVMMGTPTFYRPYFHRVEKEFLTSLKFIVGGAEKTPPGFGQRWESHFGSDYLEGYGLTETSPVVSCNLPERPTTDSHGTLPPARKWGSVGQLFPGMAARVTDPASGDILPLGQVGMLELRGANVFTGYLDDPAGTEAVFRDGWFVTGDLARMDEEGYLYIEGRLSRFSKIGGEMVPHGTVEQAIAKVFQWEDNEAPVVAVTGITDATKGESLVLVSTVEIALSELRERLTKMGLPNLWIPRRIKQVPNIPTLASGKLDLRALDSLAQTPGTESDD